MRSNFRWHHLDDRRQWQALRRRSRKRLDGVCGDFRKRHEHGIATSKLPQEAKTARYSQSRFLGPQPHSFEKWFAKESANSDPLNRGLTCISEDGTASMIFFFFFFFTRVDSTSTSSEEAFLRSEAREVCTNCGLIIPRTFLLAFGYLWRRKKKKKKKNRDTKNFV